MVDLRTQSTKERNLSFLMKTSTQSAQVMSGVFFIDKNNYRVNPRDTGLVYPLQFSVQWTHFSVVMGAMATS